MAHFGAKKSHSEALHVHHAAKSWNTNVVNLYAFV
jgi:hypothetical protein